MSQLAAEVITLHYVVPAVFHDPELWDASGFHDQGH